LASDFPRFLVPSTVLVLAPCEVVCPSPPRFRSQAFSTSQRFPGRLKVCGLVSCHYRPWDPPFRAFPSQGSRASLEALSRGCLLPCSYPPVSRSVLFFAVRLRFHSTSTLSRGCLSSPEDYGLPFHKPRSVSRSSRALISRARFFFSPASPTSKLSSPRETVPSTSGYPSAVGRCSPGLSPLRSFLLPHLGSSTRSASWTEHAPSSADSGSLLRGPQPPESGELFPSTSTQKELVDGFQPP
jgi:hypothetical protein